MTPSPMLSTGQLSIQATQTNCPVHMDTADRWTQSVARGPVVEMAWYIMFSREKISTWLSMKETSIRGMSSRGTESLLSYRQNKLNFNIQ